MYTAEYYFVEIVSALIGISYPFIFQIIARIDEKYKSVNLVRLFKKETTYKFFKIFYVILLVICVSMPNMVGKTGTDLEYQWWSPQGIAMAIVLGALINSIVLFVKIGNYYDPQDLCQLIDRKLKKRGAFVRNQLKSLRNRQQILRTYSRIFSSGRWPIPKQIIRFMTVSSQRCQMKINNILEQEIQNDLTYSCMRDLLGFSIRENDVALYLSLNDILFWSMAQVQAGRRV